MLARQLFYDLRRYTNIKQRYFYEPGLIIDYVYEYLRVLGYDLNTAYLAFATLNRLNISDHFPLVLHHKTLSSFLTLALLISGFPLRNVLLQHAVDKNISKTLLMILIIKTSINQRNDISSPWLL